MFHSVNHTDKENMSSFQTKIKKKEKNRFSPTEQAYVGGVSRLGVGGVRRLT